MTDSTPIDIGSRLELFVDHLLIDEMRGVTLRMQTPRCAGPVFKFDQPWDGPHSGAPNIVKDGNRYRLFYEGYPKYMSKKDRCLCVAESEDGVHFTRPDVGLIERFGTKHNNVVYLTGMEKPHLHIFQVFLDTRPGVPEDQRYKATGGIYRAGGIHVFGSPDGIRWRLLSNEPAVTLGPIDTHNVAFWSEHEGHYLIYFRTWYKVDANGQRWWVQRPVGDPATQPWRWEKISDRAVHEDFPPNLKLEKQDPVIAYRWTARAMSPDFIHWSPPEDMQAIGHAPHEQIYTNMTIPYFRAPHIYISPGNRFMYQRRVLSDAEATAIQTHPISVNHTSDVVLMTSRGGAQYDRTFLESFIRPEIGAGHWTYGSTFIAHGIVPSGGSDTEVSMYANTHLSAPTAHLLRYTLRTDGFVSVNAPFAGGELVTKPLKFTGDRLVLNYWTSAAGDIRVAIENERGQALPGYAMDDCMPLIGNHIAREVMWKHGPSVSALAGRPVRLRFVMKDADLYSLRFQNG